MTGGTTLSENPGIWFQDMEIQDCSQKTFILNFFLIILIDPNTEVTKQSEQEELKQTQTSVASHIFYIPCFYTFTTSTR